MQQVTKTILAAGMLTLTITAYGGDVAQMTNNIGWKTVLTNERVTCPYPMYSFRVVDNKGVLAGIGCWMGVGNRIKYSAEDFGTGEWDVRDFKPIDQK